MKKNILVIALSVFVLVLAGTTFYFWKENKTIINKENKAIEFKKIIIMK